MSEPAIQCNRRMRSHEPVRTAHLTELGPGRSLRRDPGSKSEQRSGNLRSPFLQLGFFDIHVSEFAGFEDFAALQALDEFGIFFAGHDLDTRVLARRHGILLRGFLRTGWTHRFRSGAPNFPKPAASLAELAVFLAGTIQLSSTKCFVTFRMGRPPRRFDKIYLSGTAIQYE
jgi:hypothetical protein